MRLTRTDYMEACKAYTISGFETEPTRYAIAQLTQLVLSALSSKDSPNKVAFEELLYPRRKVKEKTETEINQEAAQQMLGLIFGGGK